MALVACSKGVKGYLTTALATYIERLPSYAPDLQPDEEGWNCLKRVELANCCCHERALHTALGTLAIAPHANVASEKMSEVARQILSFLEPSPRPVPVLKRLLGTLIATASALHTLYG